MIKKLFKLVGGVVLVAVIGVGALIWVTFGNNKPMVDGADAGGGRAVKDGYVFSYVVYAGQQQLVLIDAGFDPEAKALLAELKRRNLNPDNVKAVFLTHGHPDHMGGLKHFPNAAVYASFAEVGLVEGRDRVRSPIAKLMGEGGPTAKVTQALADGDTVKVGDLEVKAFLVPGHTDGSMVYLANRVLYFGDSAAATRGGEIAPSPWLFSNDTEQNRKALKALAGKLAGADVKTMVFAHSGALDGTKALTDFASAN